jgi:hypothetical protein
MDVVIHIFLTSAVVGNEWSVSRLAHFTLEERDPIPTGQASGWAPEPVRKTLTGEKFFPYRESNSNPSAAQPITSHYTDCAIPNPEAYYAHEKVKM